MSIGETKNLFSKRPGTMKRRSRNRGLRLESLEDRKLMTAVTELGGTAIMDPADCPNIVGNLDVEEGVIWGQTIAKSAVGKAENTHASNDLHNNGAFLPWHRGYLTSAKNLGTDSYTENDDRGYAENDNTEKN